MMMWHDISKSARYTVYLLMAAALYFVFFQQLDSFHIRTWDESTYAVNAYEMWKNENYLTPHMKGVADFEWNTKPPLMLWLQVIFIKFIGFNELAVRLPSALAASITAFSLFFVTARRYHWLMALTIFIAFITCMGISTFHASRTGDLDAVLLLFLWLSLSSYYTWLENNDSKSLWYFFLFLTLAYFTKSIAAFLFLPSIFLLTLIHKKVKYVLTQKTFYEGLLLLLTSITAYVALRQNDGPYIEGLISHEFNRVYEIKHHVQPFDYYFNALFEGHFFWTWLAIPGIILALRDAQTKKLALFLFVCFAGYFFVISYASVKLIWYMLPEMLILSWFAGYAIYRIVGIIKPENTWKQHLFWVLCLMAIPYYFAARQSYKSDIPEQQKKDEALVNYVFKHKKEQKLHRHYLITSHFNLPLYAYKYMYNEKGMDFEIRADVRNIPIKQMVALSEPALELELLKKYQVYLVEEKGDVKRFYIKGKRL